MLTVFVRSLYISLVILSFLFALTSCAGTGSTYEEDGEDHNARIDRLYRECIDAGGSFYTHSGGGFDCVSPEVDGTSDN